MTVTRYKTNPFLTDMVVPVKGRQVRLSRLGDDDNILLNQSTGEVHGTHVVTYKQVDGEQFIKLFANNIAMTFDLSAAGIKAFNVLLWVVQNKAISHDEVYLDMVSLTEFIEQNQYRTQPIKMSNATLKRGISELEKAQIIAKTLRQGRYFINPNFVFNGDRVAFTTLIERKKKQNSVPSNLNLLEEIEVSS